MLRRKINLQAMAHVEHLVHLTPVGVALLLDCAEQGRYREEVILDDAAVVAHKMEHLGLCPTGAVHHTVNLRTQGIKQLLHYRRIRTRWREYQFTRIQRRALYSIGQFQCPTVNQFLGHSLVIALRVLLSQVFAEHIMAR